MPQRVGMRRAHGARPAGNAALAASRCANTCASPAAHRMNCVFAQPPGGTESVNTPPSNTADARFGRTHSTPAQDGKHIASVYDAG